MNVRGSISKVHPPNFFFDFLQILQAVGTDIGFKNMSSILHQGGDLRIIFYGVYLKKTPNLAVLHVAGFESQIRP